MENTSANIATPKDCIDNHRGGVRITAPIRKHSAIRVNNTLTRGSISHTTTHSYDPSSTGRIKQDRPAVSNPRLIRPKVVHPSPYYRSDLMANRSQFNDRLEAPIGVPQTFPMHQQQAAQIPEPADPSNIVQHMEYLYGNHPNYHNDIGMLRNRRLPLDISHPNFIAQPAVYSPYDRTYVPYRNEMERMPPPPCNIDPYIQHNMHVPPFNPNIGYLPPKPAAPPNVYGYLNPQHSHHPHPAWIYPHILER